MSRKVFSKDPAHPKYPVAFVRLQKSTFSQGGAEFEFMAKLSLRRFGSAKWFYEPGKPVRVIQIRMTCMAFDSRLCCLQALRLPLNPLKSVESRSRPCRVAVANVLGATKVFSVNLLYGFPARLLVFLVILQSERSKLAWNRPMEGGELRFVAGSSPAAHRNGEEQSWDRNWQKTRKIRTNLIFENQIRSGILHLARDWIPNSKSLWNSGSSNWCNIVFESQNCKRYA